LANGAASYATKTELSATPLREPVDRAAYEFNNRQRVGLLSDRRCECEWTCLSALEEARNVYV
jgi:hypothetical protein